MNRGAGTLITDLFAYGTLKRGECRESMWPKKPIRVREAFIRARLYDIGPYPAIRIDEPDEPDELDEPDKADEPDDATLGDDSLDWIAGELWSFEPDDVLPTIAVLDEIEQTNQRGYDNLYDHILVRAYERPNAGPSFLALVYQWSRPRSVDHPQRLRPREDGTFVSWSAGHDER